MAGVDREELAPLHRRQAKELEARLAQQSAVARLGALGLRDVPLAELTARAAADVAPNVGAELVLLSRPAGDQFEILASAGDAAVPVGTYLRPPVPPQRLVDKCASGAVTATGLAASAELRDDPLVLRGLHSMAAVLAGDAVAPLGVLSVHFRGCHELSADDLTFLETVANVLAASHARRAVEDAARYDALHDALTGLPNRALLQDRLAQALNRARREQIRLAVLFLDVDKLKVLNDSLGHGAGDEVLRAIGPRLADVVRASDTVARFGGDEFVIVCEDVRSERHALALAQRVVDAFQPAFMVAGEPRHVRTSVGVVVTDGATTRDADELIRDADAAMYSAKDRGRGRVALFDDRMRARAVARLRLEEDLRRAIGTDQLRLAFQPVIQLEDGAVRGVEALVRWQHPEHGPVAPDEFIPIAEETGLIVPLGEWVLREAVRRLAAWRRGRPGLRVSVNLSARQVVDAPIVDTVADALRGSGVPPERLILEITERLLLDDSPAVTAALVGLKALGVTLVLDDFGTGYSSLSYLRRYPLDGIKIDRSFVMDLGADGLGDDAIVAAMVSMAGALGLAVVPEGVETDGQLRRLRDLGCAVAQGFHLGRPMPADAFTAYLEQRDAPALALGV